ncbi:hypothetical protein Vadar_026154 [Vaccinium darrowii]|uniref:Uncharacterized protein n=1 Tax=Vaccinium darrowii TaxID=229202 RepID=A0ACB7YRS8_9ERIC|nr:hypothetical protein Vadar_026154 [Vaccinium darrowii]
MATSSTLASSSSSSSSSFTTSIPPTLAFLVSNFNSLVNIKLDAEEVQIHKHEASTSAKVFVATTKGNTFEQGSSSFGTIDNTFSSGNLGMASQFQMFQPQSGQGMFYPQSGQVQHRSNSYDNRNKGGNRNSVGTQNGGFSGFAGSQNGFNTPQNGFLGFSPQQGSFGNAVGSSGGFGYAGGPGVRFNGPLGPCNYAGGPSASSVSQPQLQFSSVTRPAAVTQYGGSGHPSMVNMVTPNANAALFSSVSPSPQWYFDSGASLHVTNDLTNLQLHHPSGSGEGVVVGNGTSIPVLSSGQSLSSDSSSGSLHSGVVPHSDIL